jgi:hypothetical protein
MKNGLAVLKLFPSGLVFHPVLSRHMFFTGASSKKDFHFLQYHMIEGTYSLMQD